MPENEDPQVPEPVPAPAAEEPAAQEPAAQEPAAAETIPQPVPVPAAAPAPILKQRWRDRAWSLRSMIAVGVAGLIIGGAAGGGIAAVASHDEGHRHRFGDRSMLLGPPGFRGRGPFGGKMGDRLGRGHFEWVPDGAPGTGPGTGPGNGGSGSGKTPTTPSPGSSG